MKLGLGLYRGLLTEDNFRFAQQAGVTHLVVHLVNYFAGANPDVTSGPAAMGWGTTDGAGRLWTEQELRDIKRSIEAHGLTWEAIENFDPAHWHDILLDGPRKRQQMEDLKQTIRTIGRVGIPIMGYNFSLAGVWGWTKGPFGRGAAMSVRYDERAIDKDTPMPNGMVWNMIYDPDAPPGVVAPVSHAELWQRYEWFLSEILPVAEEAGVRLALHPDDPPADTLRGTARLVNQPQKYQRMLDLVPSPASALEFCLGSLAEMTDGDVYEAVEHYGRQGKIAYVHFRNVRGKVPHYQEVFVDEGDIDMLRVLRILREVGYEGVLIPDHTPEMSCDAPWHAGMAYALGYMRAALQAVERLDVGAETSSVA
ncbi:MAG TPA: mannonate dehydratase [Gemmatimonadaceae bacterium]|nr:mannonate dehydratase [Gemmatimonadaceae bacterium]